ncbi:MAG: hypothetical protein ACKN83_07545, partial [Vulcanococcus sp.]
MPEALHRQQQQVGLLADRQHGRALSLAVVGRRELPAASLLTGASSEGLQAKVTALWLLDGIGGG